MKKTCPKCKRVLFLESFGKNKNKKYGLQCYCKDCKRALDRPYSREYRRKNPEWKKMDNKRNANLIRKLVREWQLKNPEKVKAHYLVNRAIKEGRLKREPCVVCGNPKSHGHHEDYSKPLEVIWSCAKLHKAIHNKLIKVESILI